MEDQLCADLVSSARTKSIKYFHRRNRILSQRLHAQRTRSQDQMIQIQRNSRRSRVRSILIVYRIVFHILDYAICLCFSFSFCETLVLHYNLHGEKGDLDAAMCFSIFTFSLAKYSLIEDWGGGGYTFQSTVYYIWFGYCKSIHRLLVRMTCFSN